ncbi:MAG: DUF4350 domain-containing protein [Planctomycetes bacterium]|nr:DUF4350 domain-containing protein [Planctomycetota bacterium]
MSTPTPDPPDDSAPPPTSRLWWATPAVGMVLLALFGMLFGGGPEKVDYGTSYDASDTGFRGVYLLLEELKYPVERSRRSSGGEVRWVLFPTKSEAKDAVELDAWVKRGGTLLLAVNDPSLAKHLGLQVTVENPRMRGITDKGTQYSAEAPDVSSLYADDTRVNGPRGGRPWGKIDGQPLITIYPQGRGEIWLVNRPDIFTNANLHGGADNQILACRLAEAMLRAKPGSRLSFDEYTHGLRDRPDLMELLFKPPVLGVTLELLLLTALALWHYGCRFGEVRPVPPPARRSKEEFLDAMAELLTRKGDRIEAFLTVRDDFLRRLEANLGLPVGHPIEQTAREAARRRGVNEALLLELLTAESPPEGRGPVAFLAALHQLETLSNECLQSGRRAR